MRSLGVKHPALLFEPGHDALDRLGEVGHGHRVRAAARGDERRLVDQVGDVGAGEAGRDAAHPVEIDAGRGLDLLEVHLEDGHARRPVGPVHQTCRSKRPGAQQRRIEDFGAVGGRQQHDALARVEAVQLRQQLVERLLLLVVGADNAGGARAAEASSSSMKMMHGAILRACSNRSRTRAAPTPTNISTNSEPEIEKNGTPASPATARASSVLPVPGGPTSRMPFGTRAPSRP